MKMYIDPRLFPTVMIIMQLLASLVYFYSGDKRRCVYLLAAAVLTFTVTY